MSMVSEIFDAAYNAFDEGLSNLVGAAMLGALILLGAYIGKMGAEYASSRVKILYVAACCIPVAVFFGFWDFKGIPDPEETQAEALYGAAKTFYYVLFTLWAGCIWSAFDWQQDSSGSQS